MSYETEVRDQLIALLREKSVQFDLIMDASTCIMHDAQTFGDDIYIFLTKVQKKFVVDFEGFDFVKYILPETYYNDPRSFLPGMLKKDMNRKPEITIG